MGTEPRINWSKHLSTSHLAAFAIAFCIGIPFAGALAEAVGGWAGEAIFVVAWSILLVTGIYLTRTFSNPSLPNLCGGMVGLTAPRPSEVWIRQLAGESAGRPLSMLVTLVAVGIGITVFNAIAKRRDSSDNSQPIAG